MFNKQQIIKSTPWILLSLSGLLILAAYFYVEVYKFNHRPDKVVEIFGKKINERYQKGITLLDKFILSNPSPSIEKLNAFSEKTDEFFNLYVIQDHTLYYWSDNLINPDSALSDSLTVKRLVQTGNGTYQLVVKKSGNLTFLLTDQIKSEFGYENEYLSPVFNPEYAISSDYRISLLNDGIPVKDSEGNFLFSVIPPKTEVISTTAIFLLYILYLSAFILFIIAVYQLYQKYTPLNKYPFLIFLFVLDILLARAVLIYFRIPAALYGSELFSPLSFAYSSYLPSLGDFFTDSLLTAILFFLVHLSFNRISKQPDQQKTGTRIKSLFLVASAVFFYYLCCFLLNILINNSSFNTDLGNFQEFTLYGLMAYFIIFFLLIAFFFISFSFYKQLYILLGWKFLTGYFLLVNAVFYIIALYFGLYLPEPMLLLLQGVYITILIFIFSNRLQFPHFTSISILVLTLTLISSYSLYVNKSLKEENGRKLLTLRLSSDRDKMGEFLFADIEKQLYSDTTLKKLLISSWIDPAKEIQCSDYLKSIYFKGYWTKYNIQVTLCFPEKSLQIRPQNYIIGCQEYFSDIINQLGEKTASPSLYFIRESYDASSYIANIPMTMDETLPKTSFLVIELTPKYVPKGLGYPELLMDKASTSRADISTYSYAIFFRRELVKNVGEYNYSVNESELAPVYEDFAFFDRNGYNHLFHVINKETSIVISKRNEGLLDKLSPFTYQLIFHIFILLLILSIWNLRHKDHSRNLDFKTRLQLMVVALVLFASLSVGFTTITNIKNLNEKKNRDMLSEKAHSVLIEIEHKLASMDILDKSQKSYLEELLTKFSLVFFSDINLYDINGRLLASSRPQIFEEGFKSELMSAEPYIQLARNKRTLFIDNERIGNYRYLSAYLPFRNEQNKLTAYINLPYFAREQELRQEISTFLVAFINIYVILTVLAVFISILAGNYLMRPLQLIRKRVSSLNLGRTNEKITYSRKDELGDLINEYNLMVDKLAESAEKLARSERETAWREMARQVAHEIKNPLTPMKLSIQHLRKSWDDQPPDWGNRLEKTTQTLIEQIDSLAAIASAFSDFAILPTPSNKKTELSAVLRSTLSLFNQHPDVNFSFTLPEKECFVFADEKQLSRVFINLFNNAVQAIPPKQAGLVEVRLYSTGEKHCIEVSDNGIGINDEQRSRIFSPNFTTKSGGMGLGLAMVKNIIDSAGGEITFIPGKQSGTVFIIELPAIEK
ncbi:MAG: HAMP domain-containing protein [Bacteroidales bacterium]|nr:HAMP domain-containing protein [Bacteroidales bacterium]